MAAQSARQTLEAQSAKFLTKPVTPYFGVFGVVATANTDTANPVFLKSEDVKPIEDDTKVKVIASEEEIQKK